MGIEAEILIPPKVYYFCTDFSFENGHVIRLGHFHMLWRKGKGRKCLFFATTVCKGASPDPEILAETLEKLLGLYDDADNADVPSEASAKDFWLYCNRWQVILCYDVKLA